MMTRSIFRELFAGFTVSVTSLSFGVAFGIQSGRGAFAGMIAAAVIPLLSSLFGGTRVKASGPTAPVTLVTALVVAQAYDRFGVHTALAEQYITLTFLCTALILFLAGVLRLGRFVGMVPQVVVLGFMNGIALLIWRDQVVKMVMNPGFMRGVLVNVGIVVLTLVLVGVLLWGCERFVWLRRMKSVLPPMLVVIVVVTLMALFLGESVVRVSMDYAPHGIGELLASVGEYVPSAELLRWEVFVAVLPLALQLAMITYLDCLLTSLVMDRLSGEVSKRNQELAAQGASNVVSAFLGGIPGAQATVRSVMLYHEGSRMRLGGVFDGVFTLVWIFLLIDVLAFVPLGVFFAKLMKAAFDIFDLDFFVAYLRERWWRDRIVSLQLLVVVVTSLLTLLVDLNVAVFVGTGLFLVLRRFVGLKDIEAGRFVDNVEHEG